jgi:hypothetical protein
MRVDSGRKKKLIVAFHFQFSNQTAWKCDTCRKQGLERRRNCGWLGANEGSSVVWARRDTRLTTCPKSYITPDSLELLDNYYTGKLFGFGDLSNVPARVVDAYCVLEKLVAEERAHVEE